MLRVGDAFLLGYLPHHFHAHFAAALATATADVNRAQATLNRAELELQFTEIKAPIAGRLSRRLVSVGNLVNANDTVLTNIVSMDPINFYFDVDERSYLAYQRQFGRNGQILDRRGDSHRHGEVDGRLVNFQAAHYVYVDVLVGHGQTHALGEYGGQHQQSVEVDAIGRPAG